MGDEPWIPVAGGCVRCLILVLFTTRQEIISPREVCVIVVIVVAVVIVIVVIRTTI
jgi:hypothetical protein